MKIKTELEGTHYYPKYTSAQMRFIKALELNDEFEKAVLVFRKKYDIPTNGFPTSMDHTIGGGIPKYLPDEKWDEYIDDENALMIRYNISTRWGVPFTYFLKYDHLINFSPVTGARFFVMSGDRMMQFLQSRTIQGRQKILCFGLEESLTYKGKPSRRALKRLIDEQWAQIHNGMLNLPRYDERNFENIYLYEEIIELKNQGLSWKEISDALQRRHRNLTDPSYAPNLYRRYKFLLTRTSKKPPIDFTD